MIAALALHWMLTAYPMPGPWATYDLSVYAQRYDGRTAANGKPYRHRTGMTCAANGYPLGSVLVIEAGNYTVWVVVTDRLDRRLGRRRIDLSGIAYKMLRYDYDFTDRTAGLIRRARVRRES